MDSSLVLPAIMRWVHMLAAVAVAGGIFFHMLVLRPAIAKALTAEQALALREPLMRRWKMIIHPSIVLFLLSGFYNYLVVTSPQHEGQALYHALFGVKFLLSLAVLGLAIVLTSTRTWSERWREGGGAWIGLTLVTLAVILIGGVMKTLPAVEVVAAP
jgi:uncharacterized membrane protein